METFHKFLLTLSPAIQTAYLAMDAIMSACNNDSLIISELTKKYGAEITCMLMLLRAYKKTLIDNGNNSSTAISECYERAITSTLIIHEMPETKKKNPELAKQQSEKMQKMYNISEVKEPSKDTSGYSSVC